MKRTSVSACVFVVATSLAGCAATGDVEYAGEVQVTSPELVTISPGVQVVADADEPLFYSDGFYWLYRDGYWFRSDSYRGGFARIEYNYVPVAVRSIDRPQVYVQYRRHAGRDHFARENRERMRTPQPQQPTYDQRYQTQPPPQQQPYQQPYNTTTPTTPPPVYQPGIAHPTPQPEGINPTRPENVTPNGPPATPNDQPIEHANPTPPVTPPGQTNRPATPPGQNRNVGSPSDRGNGSQTQRPEDRGPDKGNRPDDRGNNGNGNGNPNAPGHNRDDRGQGGQGNPSAPSRIAPNTPSNAPASPNPPGAAKDADKDKHDHGQGTTDRDDQATPPSKNKDDKPKKKNEKY